MIRLGLGFGDVVALLEMLGDGVLEAVLVGFGLEVG